MVCSASKLRCRFETRFAGVRWTRPSIASAEGVTVAALAAHMGEAEAAAAEAADAPAEEPTEDAAEAAE